MIRFSFKPSILRFVKMESEELTGILTSSRNTECKEKKIDAIP
jgi:hypothetical protein